MSPTRPMRALHLFAGAGGSVLAGRMLGWTSVGCVEIDPFCAAVLEERGEHVIGRDVTTFSGVPHVGSVDVVVGGSPCQDLSVAGKRAGLGGERSSLWHHQLRIAVECRAPFIFWENVAGALTSHAGRDFGVILRGLDGDGYDAQWRVLRASDVGSPHARDRVFLLAHSRRWGGRQGIHDAEPGEHLPPVARAHRLGEEPAGQPGLDGIPDGVARRVDCTGPENRWPACRSHPAKAWEPPRLTASGHNRIKRLVALGNGWVPAQAVLAWRQLTAST